MTTNTKAFSERNLKALFYEKKLMSLFLLTLNYRPWYAWIHHRLRLSARCEYDGTVADARYAK
jgi:hypothetical protein